MGGGGGERRFVLLRCSLREGALLLIVVEFIVNALVYTGSLHLSLFLACLYTLTSKKVDPSPNAVGFRDAVIRLPSWKI